MAEEKRSRKERSRGEREREKKGRRERKERERREMQRGDQNSCKGKRGDVDRCDAEIGVGVWLDRNSWNEDSNKRTSEESEARARGVR